MLLFFSLQFYSIFASWKSYVLINLFNVFWMNWLSYFFWICPMMNAHCEIWYCEYYSKPFHLFCFLPSAITNAAALLLHLPLPPSSSSCYYYYYCCCCCCLLLAVGRDGGGCGSCVLWWMLRGFYGCWESTNWRYLRTKLVLGVRIIIMHYFYVMHS